MFRECIEYQKKRKRSLFGITRGTTIETTDKFKYDKELATVIDKVVLPVGFDEKHLVKIKYQHNDEEEILDCSYKEFWVKIIE